MRISLLFAALSLYVSCVPRDPEPAAIRPVKVTVAAGASSMDKNFAGMATPDDAVNLAFKLSGQVRDIPVSQGESVKKGALLAELDPRDVELQVSATRSAYEEARSQQQRMQRLLEHQAVSRQEAEAAATRYAQARSTYENTLDLLNDTRLRAPFSGVIERKYVTTYERVQAGQVLYVGDSNVDIQTAQNAHVESCGVLWGFRTEEELRAEGASYLVHTPRQLADLALGQAEPPRLFDVQAE